jgi:hypothetical protein
LVMNEMTLQRTAAPVTALKSVPNSPPRSSSSPKSDCVKAAEREAARIRWLLAINPNTPTPVLEHLANDNSPTMLERIAENPRSSSATLTRLAAHGNPQVRAAVAENANLSPKTAWRLAQDASADVRMRLAESYFAPLEVLRMLCGDENPYVQHRAQLTLGRLVTEITAFRLA